MMRKIWPFTFSLVQFAGIAGTAPIFVLYYQHLGFNGAQIGILTGVAPLIAFISAPLWTGLADAKGWHRSLMGLSILLSVVLQALFPLPGSFGLVFLTAILLNISMSPIMAFADSATMHMLGAEKSLYGRIRMGGTIGFALTAYVAGLAVEKYGLKVGYWIGAAIYLVALAVSQKLRWGHAAGARSPFSGAGKLLANPRWVLFLILALAGGTASSALNTYFYPFMHEIQASEATMGLALTIGTLAELPVFFFGGWLLKRLRPSGLLLASLAFTGARLLLFTVAGSPGFVLAMQPLNGMSFPALWMAGVAFADENSPEGMHATAQGLLGAMTMGIGRAVAGFVGGPLLESIGGRGLYLVFGVAVLAIGLVGGLLLLKRERSWAVKPT